jgi:amino acid exporter
MDQVGQYLPNIILAYTACLLGTVSPGPNVMTVIGTSMSAGRKSGIALAFGVASGAFLWASLSALGLTALLAAYAWTLTVLKIAGGLYLIWLGYKAIRSAMSKHDLEARTLDGGQRTLAGYYLRGLTVQMTNPKAILAWIAIMALGLQANAPWWVAAVIVVGTFPIVLAVHCGYALAFSTAVMVRLYSNARRSIQGVLGAFYTVAGLKLLTSRS